MLSNANRFFFINSNYTSKLTDHSILNNTIIISVIFFCLLACHRRSSTQWKVQSIRCVWNHWAWKLFVECWLLYQRYFEWNMTTTRKHLSQICFFRTRDFSARLANFNPLLINVESNMVSLKLYEWHEIMSLMMEMRIFHKLWNFNNVKMAILQSLDSSILRNAADVCMCGNSH